MSVSGQRPPLTAKTRHSPMISSVNPKAQRNFPNQASQGRARIDADMTAQIAVCSSLICWSLYASTAGESCTCSMAKNLLRSAFASVFQASVCQPPPDFFGRQAGYADHFIPAGLAGCNSNGGTRYLQKFCEKIYARVVGFAVDWRGGQGQFQRVAYFAGDGVFPGARVDFER